MKNFKKAEFEKFFNIRGCNDLALEDILKYDESKDFVSDLIYLIGYDFVTVKVEQGNKIVFYAGMFDNDLDEKLVIEDYIMHGKLSEWAVKAFHVVRELLNQSNDLVYLPKDLRMNFFNELADRNNVDISFINKVRIRLSS